MIFYKYNKTQVIRNHYLEIIKEFFINLLFLLLKPFKLLFKLLALIFKKLYNFFYPLKDKIRKSIKIFIFLYSLAVIGFNIYKYIKYKTIDWRLLLHIPFFVITYLALKLILKIYHYFIGEYQLMDTQVMYTEEYIVNYLPKMIKVFGRTGAGKDTWQVGCTSVLARSFKDKTIEDIERIKEICYIFDFDLLDQDLINNYQGFLTFSREKIKANFMKMAMQRGLYIKNYYKRKISVKFLLADLKNIEDDPLYKSNYCYGNGVNTKHFLELIMYEYIEWFIRINFENNFVMSNQPLIEDLDSGLKAKKFSFNFIRTKSQESVQMANGKKVKLKENIFFPWKDRLVVSETECGSWYMNRDGDTIGEIIHSGMRDFKAYQRHFILDFYWFQVDQAPERTAKLFRELDHVYAAILNREEVEGGKKKNAILELFLLYYNRRISQITKKANKAESRRIRRQPKLDYLMRLYYSSKDEKYKNQHDSIIKKLKVKPLPLKYYKYKAKVSDIKKKIEANKKDGYIIETVCISKAPSSPVEYQTKRISTLCNPDSNREASFVTNFVFKTSDCERYDTRYMRSLAEARSKETKVEFIQVPNWSDSMRMTKEDVMWMGYTAAKDTFGISEDEFEKFRYTDEYKKYVNPLK